MNAALVIESNSWQIRKHITACFQRPTLKPNLSWPQLSCSSIGLPHPQTKQKDISSAAMYLIIQNAMFQGRGFFKYFFKSINLLSFPLL